jgi:hypothetical protein
MCMAKTFSYFGLTMKYIETNETEHLQQHEEDLDELDDLLKEAFEDLM